MKDKKVYKFKEKENIQKKDQFVMNMECLHNMKHDARIWTLVHIISEVLNQNNVTYDEFIEIISNIDHFTHHQAELQAHLDIIDYKHDNDIDLEDEIDEEEFEIDIDDDDGIWFGIPVIG